MCCVGRGKNRMRKFFVVLCLSFSFLHGSAAEQEPVSGSQVVFIDKNGKVTSTVPVKKEALHLLGAFSSIEQNGTFLINDSFCCLSQEDLTSFLEFVGCRGAREINRFLAKLHSLGHFSVFLSAARFFNLKDDCGHYAALTEKALVRLSKDELAAINDCFDPAMVAIVSNPQALEELERAVAEPYFVVGQESEPFFGTKVIFIDEKGQKGARFNVHQEIAELAGIFGSLVGKNGTVVVSQGACGISENELIDFLEFMQCTGTAQIQQFLAKKHSANDLFRLLRIARFFDLKDDYCHHSALTEKVLVRRSADELERIINYLDSAMVEVVLKKKALQGFYEYQRREKSKESSSFLFKHLESSLGTPVTSEEVKDKDSKIVLLIKHGLFNVLTMQDVTDLERADKHSLISVGDVRIEVKNFFLTSLEGGFDDVSSYPQSYRAIKISNGCLMHVPSNIFMQFSFLRELDLSGNALCNLPDKAFTGLENVEKLDLSNNRLREIIAYNFTGLEKLKVLSLDHNQIKTIDKKAFYNLVCLETLNLEKNKITELTHYVFSMQKGLRRLDLSENGLIQVPSDVFGYLKNLTSLELGSNPLSFQMNSFRGLENLKELSLFNVPLEVLRFTNFTFLRNLEKLDVKSFMNPYDIEGSSEERRAIVAKMRELWPAIEIQS